MSEVCRSPILIRQTTPTYEPNAAMMTVVTSVNRFDIHKCNDSITVQAIIEAITQVDR